MCSTDATTDLGLTDKNSSCSCGTHEQDSAPVAISADAAEYLVEGMTCSHCVSSVTEELSALDGVEGVTVELNVGGASKVSVASNAPLDLDTVRAAVEEAGYSLAGGPR